MSWPTDLASILKRVDEIDPIRYGYTRNFADGAVTRLSPYFSRGVISTKQVLHSVLSRRYQIHEIEKFVQELAWRDYWQLVWRERGDDINTDLKHPQQNCIHQGIPSCLIHANTGIEAIDQALVEFYHTGYLHNHLRMYIASLACNVGAYHWYEPARWMYYHLLDADWASNALSWQWVAGCNSSKKYYANQENINRYFYSTQRGTFLDVPYEQFSNLSIPPVLKTSTPFTFSTALPAASEVTINAEWPLLIYNFYNLDPRWHEHENANRILLLEPDIFTKYPVNKNTVDFILELARQIPGMQVCVNSFEKLHSEYPHQKIIYKEHPLNCHYEGVEEPRDWMVPLSGYYPSFFAYWKKARKLLFD